MLDKGTASVPESFEGLLGDGGVGTFLAFLDSLVTAYGRLRSLESRNRPRLSVDACAVLKSALLREICERLVNPQTGHLRRNKIFIPVLTGNTFSKAFSHSLDPTADIDRSFGDLILCFGLFVVLGHTSACWPTS